MKHNGLIQALRCCGSWLRITEPDDLGNEVVHLDCLQYKGCGGYNYCLRLARAVQDEIISRNKGAKL